jgi:protein involved in polysaccharide export with SLBB domain
MTITTCFRRAFLGLILSLPALISGLDLRDLRSGKIDLQDMGNLKEIGGDPEYSPSLSGDMAPFVGDFPLQDSLSLVGPGDQFQIFYESVSLEKQVNPEGNIILNRIGTLRLGGLNLFQAKKLILEKIQTAHKKNECFVNLSRPKTMKVFVTGGVIAPGAYQVAGNLRLSDALAMARGFSPMAQRDSVRITRADGSTASIAIKLFMTDGRLDANPYLTQGEVINVPLIDYAQPWVSVRKDSTILAVQLRPGETLQDILFKFNSFTTPPPYSMLKVKEKTGKETTVSPTELTVYRPEAEAQIEIFPQRFDVYVGGAVMRPGFQMYRSNMKVMQYISEAGLTVGSKVPAEIKVTHADGSIGSVSVQGGFLRPGDAVFVDQNSEQRFLIYTPILLGLASLTLTVFSLLTLNQD